MTRPEPSGVWRTWFPALVRLPDARLMYKAKVYATDAGLFIYGTGANGQPTEVFHSPILLDKTAEPGTDYASEKRGHVIVTDAGRVTVQQTAGSSCGCNRELRTYAPTWAGVEKTWGVTA